jgi:hypothetical protein
MCQSSALTGAAARSKTERARLSAFHRGFRQGVHYPADAAPGQASWDSVQTGVTRYFLSQSREHLPHRP